MLFNCCPFIQFVVFVLVNLEENESIIKSIVKLEDLHNEKLFKLPKLEYLKNNKLVIYYSDIKDKKFAL